MVHDSRVEKLRSGPRKSAAGRQKQEAEGDAAAEEEDEGKAVYNKSYLEAQRKANREAQLRKGHLTVLVGRKASQ